MDFRNFFRRFFYDQDNFNHDNDFDRDSFTNHDDRQRNIRRNDIIFDNPEVFESPNDMFRQMEDMFNRMFSSPFGMIGFPNFNEHIPEDNKSPRSIMLKESDEESSSSSGVKDFEEFRFRVLPFNPRTEVEDFEEPVISPFKPGNGFFEKSHSFSKFSSIKTIRLPDGTIEEQRTVLDSNGKKTTKIRRTIADTTHEVITKMDEQGINEKEENFINMDESQLPEFEQKWSGLRGNPDEGPDTQASLALPSSSPTYLYLLRKFFGSSMKGKIETC